MNKGMKRSREGGSRIKSEGVKVDANQVEGWGKVDASQVMWGL